jgi:hypothetical protein
VDAAAVGSGGADHTLGEPGGHRPGGGEEDARLLQHRPRRLPAHRPAGTWKKGCRRWPSTLSSMPS